MLTVYHTSSEIVTSPDVYHSRDALDFGPGFYLTTLLQQAKDYSRRFLKLGLQPYLNKYQLDESYKSFYKVKEFIAYDKEWLDFVVACRKAQPHEVYDVIIGGIANDIIFNTINLYLDGLIDKEETLRRLIFQKPNMQICINNQEIIDKYLKYINTSEI